MSEPEPSRGLLSTVMFPVLQRLRALMIFVGLVIAVAAVVALVRPRRYEAGVTLATVGNPKLGGGLSSTLAASVLGGSGLNLGLQATPAIMARLLTLDGVLLRVAATPFRGGELMAGVLGRPVDGVPYETRLRKLRKVISASYDRQTGLVTLRVLHKDSAVVRVLAERIVEEASATFVRTSKAQAAELRDAQTARVDSAAAQLRSAEEALVRFTRGNRNVPEYSLVLVEQTRLQRDADLAKQVYTQAVGDRESAVAKLLEDTPAVVVVDGVPDRLLLRPRFGSLIVAGSAFVALVLGVAAILLWTRLVAAAEGGDASARLAVRLFLPRRLADGIAQDP